MVVFGPRTRLGQAFCTWVSAHHDLLLVARDPAERDRLSTAHPQAATYAAWESTSPVPTSQQEIGIICCALGPLHPGAPDLAADSVNVARDLAALARLLDAWRSLRVHVVFVSSVLALQARRGRRYYAGFKSLLEECIAALVADRPGTVLSVLYPGRLVEGRRRPLDWLHTTYGHLAKRMAQLVLSAPPVRQIVGWDARLLMAAANVVGLGQLLVGRV